MIINHKYYFQGTMSMYKEYFITLFQRVFSASSIYFILLVIVFLLNFFLISCKDNPPSSRQENPPGSGANEVDCQVSPCNPNDKGFPVSLTVNDSLTSSTIKLKGDCNNAQTERDKACNAYLISICRDNQQEYKDVNFCQNSKNSYDSSALSGSGSFKMKVEVVNQNESVLPSTNLPPDQKKHVLSKAIFVGGSSSSWQLKITTEPETKAVFKFMGVKPKNNREINTSSSGLVDIKALNAHLITHQGVSADIILKLDQTTGSPPHDSQLVFYAMPLERYRSLASVDIDSAFNTNNSVHNFDVSVVSVANFKNVISDPNRCDKIKKGVDLISGGGNVINFLYLACYITNQNE